MTNILNRSIFTLIVMVATLSTSVGLLQDADAYHIEEFSFPYVLDPLTESQIMECETIYDDFVSLSDIDFYNRYQLDKISGNCIMLYEDLLWDYDGSDRYEKLSERSAELIQERENELEQKRGDFYINSRSVTALQIPGTFLFEFEGCTGDQTMNADDITVVSDKETILLTKYVGEQREIPPGTCNLVELQIRADDPSSIMVAIPSLGIEVPVNLDDSIQEPETDEIEEIQIIQSPRAQVSSGVEPTEVVCKEGLELLLKNNGSPACVTSSTAEKLIERGWGSR